MMQSDVFAERAEQLCRDALICDMVWPLDFDPADTVGNDYSKLLRFKHAGVNLLSVTLAGDRHNSAQALAIVADARRRLAALPEVQIVHRIGDIEAARRAGKLAVALHFEGTRCLERNLDLIEAFRDLGIRHNLLAFNSANSAGGGCADANDGGLTRFGARVVEEMQRVGVLVDLSHCGPRTSLDALARARRPMVFSHSNAAALAPSFRNISDEQIRAVAATGGLVGISGCSGYLGSHDDLASAVVRHIEHVCQLVGPKHVGLGLDVVFDGAAISAWIRSRPDEWPVAADPHWPGFSYVLPEQLPEIVAGLLAGGFTNEEIEDILGRNWLRVCEAAWQ
ncbi:dipeptidase [Peristeroidobacter soli]|jgi:membrane dipeptidase|uniref:dipeptidase n=1 Tax=Peristeroidobacter soli TaxID=2497877 RepID=UPI00101D1264|nr:membrane dipeptidase [Peristeroidobacter soli]